MAADQKGRPENNAEHHRGRTAQRSLLTMARSDPSPNATAVDVDVGLFISKPGFPTQGSNAIVGDNPGPRTSQKGVGITRSNTEVFANSSENIRERLVHANACSWPLKSSNFINREPTIGRNVYWSINSRTTNGDKSGREVIEVHKLHWGDPTTDLETGRCPR